MERNCDGSVPVTSKKLYFRSELLPHISDIMETHLSKYLSRQKRAFPTNFSFQIKLRKSICDKFLHKFKAPVSPISSFCKAETKAIAQFF